MRALLLVLSLHVRGDRWFGEDKLRHFFVSAVIESVSYSGLRAVGVRHDDALHGAVGVTLGAGVAKEWHDRRSGGDFSIRDFVWDVAGTAAMYPVLAHAH